MQNIQVCFLRPWDARFRYRFITEELFEYQTEDVMIPGMMRDYTYEEFHPDHELTIHERTANMLSGWLDRSAGIIEIYLGKTFMQPDGEYYSREEAVKRLQRVLDQYAGFELGAYTIDHISFVLRPDNGPLEALGHAKGCRTNSTFPVKIIGGRHSSFRFRDSISEEECDQMGCEHMQSGFFLLPGQHIRDNRSSLRIVFAAYAEIFRQWQ